MKQQSVVPLLDYMKDYRQSDLKKDLYAAIMVSILLIPQGMAYALLAGLPPVHGLYTAIFPTILYGFFGSSRQLSVGPVAVVSIMVFAGVAPLAEPGSLSYIAIVVFLTLLVGLMQIFMAVVRLGTLMTFVPQEIIRGFTSALAVTIILNQVGQLVGVSFKREAPFFYAFIDLVKNLTEANTNVLLFSFVLFAFYLLINRIKLIPPTLIFVFFSACFVAFSSLEQIGIKTVGYVPNELPLFQIPTLIKKEWLPLLTLAFFIALISFLESYAMASSLAKKTKDPVDPNQELFALGLANVFGSFFCSFPAAGAFSRSAINAQAGARSGLSSLFAALLIVLSLTFISDAFMYLPLSALALIIIVAAKKLIDLPLLSINRMTKSEDWLVIITFLSALFLGLQQGFFIGIMIHLFLHFISYKMRFE